MLHCPRWHELRRRYLSELIESVPGLAPEQMVIALLGGEADRKRINNWLFPAHSEPSSDDYVALGGDSDDEEDDHEVDRNYDFELVMRWGCLRVALFLSSVIRARAPIIRSLRGPSGLRLDQPSAAGQRHNR